MSVDTDVYLASWLKDKVFHEPDWVSKKVDTWSRLLAPLRETARGVLEIGSLEGRSALFFLNYLPNTQVTCIDPFPKGREATFDQNVVEFEGRVEKIRDYSFPALIRLRRQERVFDLIYIDGDHHREAVMLDSIFSWPMLRRGGILIWDDYGAFKKNEPMSERPTSAIDGFLAAYAGDYEELQRANQMVVKKTADDSYPTLLTPLRKSPLAGRPLKHIIQRTFRRFGYELHRVTE
jgi:predicted O-methyltransferase YrrM